MSNPKFSDTEFIDLWNKLGSPTLIAAKLGVSLAYLYRRRNSVQAKYKVDLTTWNDTSTRRIVIHKEDGRIDTTVENGTIIVFSDAHFWPNIRTTAFRGLLTLCKQLKPIQVHCNGDAFDGSQISRFPSIHWYDKQKKPTVLQELEATKESLLEVKAAAPGAELFWELGNHDARYEARLAAAAPEFEGVPGFTLKEHFPEWRPCWTCWINGNVRINHFYHTGLHDTHNNILKGQCHQVTGHTHSLKVAEWTNAKGETLYGVNTGTLANALDGHNADYQRGMHGNHRSGFAVLTFRDGRLLRPELVSIWDEDTIDFRGHLLHADTGEIV